MLADILYVALAIIILLSTRLKKLWKHILHGSFLFLYGLFQVLAYFSVYPLPFQERPFLVYIIAITVIQVGASLVIEGFRSRDKFGIYAIVMGCILLILSVLPTLNSMAIVSVTLPAYPVIIAYFGYLFAGFFLLIATLVLPEFKD